MKPEIKIAATKRELKQFVKVPHRIYKGNPYWVPAMMPDEQVGFLFTVPSLSKAFQKSKGRRFPFGWYHLMKALKGNDVLDIYMAGIKKKYRGKGVDLLMVIEIVKTGLERGFKYAGSNLELETNTKVQALWKHFNPRRHRYRRIFKKQIPAAM